MPNLETFEKEAESLLLELLAIPGGSGQESKVMDFIVARLTEAGVESSQITFDDAHKRSPKGGEIGNLVVKLPGTKAGPRRMLAAHTDTVPLCVGAKPVQRGKYLIPADKTTGLGADDRAGVAVTLNAALHILKNKLPHPPLTFLWTVQEEIGLYGARHAKLSLLGKPKLAFNFDGGAAEKITIGATGGYRMDIIVRGIASHAGAAPEQGVSAITIASLAVADLFAEGWLGRVEKGNQLGTSNVGVIRGGDASNVVTPLVEIRAEARSHNPAFRAKIVRAIEKAFHAAAKKVRNVRGESGSVEIVGQLDYEAFRLPSDDPSLAAVEKTIRSLGGQPERAISNGGLDANWLSERGLPTVTLGCGQETPHTPAERLYLPEFRRACEIALRLATGEAE